MPSTASGRRLPRMGSCRRADGAPAREHGRTERFSGTQSPNRGRLLALNCGRCLLPSGCLVDALANSVEQRSKLTEIRRLHAGSLQLRDRVLQLLDLFGTLVPQ
jgi:hypothetical protein